MDLFGRLPSQPVTCAGNVTSSYLSRACLNVVACAGHKKEQDVKHWCLYVQSRTMCVSGTCASFDLPNAVCHKDLAGTSFSQHGPFSRNCARWGRLYTIGAAGRWLSVHEYHVVVVVVVMRAPKTKQSKTGRQKGVFHTRRSRSRSLFGSTSDFVAYVQRPCATVLQQDSNMAFWAQRVAAGRHGPHC